MPGRLNALNIINKNGKISNKPQLTEIILTKKVLTFMDNNNFNTEIHRSYLIPHNICKLDYPDLNLYR